MMNKKAVSLMVSYVLIVIISLALAGLVYGYLKYYLPNDDVAECETDIFLVLDSYTCTSGTLTMNVANRGLFNADGVFIRLREPQFRVKALATKEILFPNGLEPQKSFSDNINLPSGKETGTYVLEIQPEEFTDKGKAICQAVINQEVICS